MQVIQFNTTVNSYQLLRIGSLIGAFFFEVETCIYLFESKVYNISVRYDVGTPIIPMLASG